MSAAALVAAALSLQAEFSRAEVSQRGTLRVSFVGKVRPQSLPRHKVAPVAVSLAARIATTDQSAPPQLHKIVLAINRHGKLDSKGLPSCHLSQIQPATSEEALDACRGALVGTGSFRAKVALPDQSPFPSNGRILAFNGRLSDKPVVFAHIYGTEPLPTSFVLPFSLTRQSKGDYSVTLTAVLPRIAANWGFVRSVSLTLKRSFQYHGRTHSYLSADCPVPEGFGAVAFDFAKASFGFEDGRTLRSTLTRRCRALG